MNRIFTLVLCVVTSLLVSAQYKTIADHINTVGKSVIVQPEKLNLRLAAKVTDITTDEAIDSTDEKAISADGYRIQVFAGNNARTAQNQASTRASKVNELFPEYATYVSFDAPYWRLKVGDFRSYEEASSALSRLKAAMPEYSAEMRLVRGRINLSTIDK